MTYRKLFFSLLTLALLVIATGCDSNGDDDDSDADLFVGTWAVVNIGDDTGDLTPNFMTIVSSLTVDLEADGTYSLLLDYNATGEGPPLNLTDRPLAGTYTVNESANALTLSVPGAALTFDYTIQSDNEVTLSAPATGLNVAFEPVTPYQGTVTMTIQRQ